MRTSSKSPAVWPASDSTNEGPALEWHVRDPNDSTLAIAETNAGLVFRFDRPPVNC
jgi:hypothetical protein